jgi:hypothetical protein
MSEFVKLGSGPHEIAHREAREKFFRGHEHIFDPLRGLCIIEDCPSKKGADDESDISNSGSALEPRRDN